MAILTEIETDIKARAAKVQDWAQRFFKLSDKFPKDHLGCPPGKNNISISGSNIATYMWRPWKDQDRKLCLDFFVMDCGLAVRIRFTGDREADDTTQLPHCLLSIEEEFDDKKVIDLIGKQVAFLDEHGEALLDNKDWEGWRLPGGTEVTEKPVDWVYVGPPEALLTSEEKQ